tara:strand:+ start:482 stop:631 length:150 start_codon:yes stop_codon:yes gene_type:complete
MQRSGRHGARCQPAFGPSPGWARGLPPDLRNCCVIKGFGGGWRNAKKPL